MKESLPRQTLRLKEWSWLACKGLQSPLSPVRVAFLLVFPSCYPHPLYRCQYHACSLTTADILSIHSMMDHVCTTPCSCPWSILSAWAYNLYTAHVHHTYTLHHALRWALTLNHANASCNACLRKLPAPSLVSCAGCLVQESCAAGGCAVLSGQVQGQGVL